MMGEHTKIQWCHGTFNPWSGCSVISQGCTNCYAAASAKRSPAILGEWGPNGTRIVRVENAWKRLFHADRDAQKSGQRRRVFVASNADVFEDWKGNMTSHNGRRLWCERHKPTRWYEEPASGDLSGCRPLTMADVRARLYEWIDLTPSMDWLLLTKRIENATSLLPSSWVGSWCGKCGGGGIYQPESQEEIYRCPECKGTSCPAWPHNVWLGTTVENRSAKKRIDILRRIPAAVRFLSIEPLLEDLGPLDLTGIHWVIIGGESGPKARPCSIEWIRSIVRQCRQLGVKVFVKQLGSNPTFGDVDPTFGDPKPGRNKQGWSMLVDKKGGDPAEWPEDVQIRELPEAEKS